MGIDIKKGIKKITGSEEIHEFNGLSSLLSAVAIACMFGIYLMYREATDYMKDWAQYSLVMFLFGITGVITMSVYRNKKLSPADIRFRKTNPDDIYYALLCYIMLLTLQVIVGIADIFLGIENVVQILYVIFAAVCEELFFRGAILGFFVYLSKGYRKYVLASGVIISAGINLSALIFMLAHVNYRGNTINLIIVFISGLILGIFYVMRKDITVNMLAHFMLNFTIVLMSGALFNAFA